jgi:hypothetical protein
LKWGLRRSRRRTTTTTTELAVFPFFFSGPVFVRCSKAFSCFLFLFRNTVTTTTTTITPPQAFLSLLSFLKVLFLSFFFLQAV